MLDPEDFSTEALCRSILERHRDTIAVQKPEFALRKLKVIVLAALEVSNSKGFHAMSLRDLSRASGVSMGGLYAYFDSKTTLLRMILQEVTEQVRMTLSAPPAQVVEDPVEHLKWLIDTHVRLTEAMLPWFAFAFMEAKAFPAAERRMAVDSEALTEEVFAHVIARGVETGRFRSETSPLLASLIKPLLQEWYVKRAKYRRRNVGIDTYVFTVQDVVLSNCLAREAPPCGSEGGRLAEGRARD